MIRLCAALCVGTLFAFAGLASGGSPAVAAEGPTVTVVTLSGTGIKKSAVFRASDAWLANWTFDCSNVGKADTLVVHVFRKSNERYAISIVNEIGKRESGTGSTRTAEPAAYLEAISACRYTIRVVDRAPASTPRPTKRPAGV